MAPDAWAVMDVLLFENAALADWSDGVRSLSHRQWILISTFRMTRRIRRKG